MWVTYIINNITEETFIKSKHIVVFWETIYGSKGWLEKIHWKKWNWRNQIKVGEKIWLIIEEIISK